MLRSKAMVLERFGEPLVEREFELSKIPNGSVLVRILASGVCGSDVHIAKGEDPRTPIPIILGHEGVGEVVNIESEKRDLNGHEINVGDWVIWNRGIVCGKCYWCKVTKQPYLCPERKVYGINMSCKDYPHLLGAYSEYMVLLNETEILKIPEDIDPAVLVMTACSGATAAHAFDELEEELFGKTVVVQGAGPLGLYSVAFARFGGATNGIVISGSKNRLEISKKLGADLTLNRYEMSVEERRKKVFDMTFGRGADVVIEATGNSSALLEGLELLRRGGTYLVMGVAVPQDPIPFKVYDNLVRKNLSIKGIWVSDASHLIKAVDITLKNSELFSTMITHRLPLNRANEALELMEKREALKVVLHP